MSQFDPSIFPLLENALYSITERLIFFTDNSGNIRFSNALAQERLGFDPQGADKEFNVIQFHLEEELEAQALRLEKKFGHLVQANFDAISLEARRQRNTIVQHWMYHGHDGNTFPVEIIITAAEDKEGNIGGYLLVARDITEMVTGKEAFRDSEERYRSVVDVMEEGIILQDADGTVTACNASAEQMMGLTMEQMNDPFTGAIPWDAIGTDGMPFPASEYPMTVSLRTGQPCSKVVMGLRKSDGTLTWFSINSRPLFRSDAAHPHAVMISLSDITERRKIETKLARAHDVAVNAAQLKSAFLANASHEIRTPLNGVIGIVDILLDTDLSDQQRSYVKTLDKSAESLLTLINDLLDLSKIEAGKNIIEEDAIDVVDIARSAVEQMSIQAQTKGIALDLMIIPEIPRQLCGDGKRLRQILSNLLFNALKFTQTGEISLRIMPHEKTNFSTTICFEVSDTGVGISREACEHIFEPFWQNSESGQSHQYASTGLGLAISKQLVELMGGRIWVESLVGKGSTFCFTVPMRKAQELPAPATRNFGDYDALHSTKHKNDPAKAEKQFSDVRVLLVEDNEVNQQVVLYQLQEWGCKTDVVGDGLQAVEACGKNEYDLVLMDCMLPFMDGYEATKEIRRREKGLDGDGTAPHNPPLYIVALTANAMQGDREKCLTAGMNDYMSKPVRFPTLRAAFERWEGLRRSKTNSNGKFHTPSEEPKPVASAALPVEESPLWRASDIDENIIEVSSLLNLRGPSHDDKLLMELIELFLKDSTKYLNAIHLSLEEDDLKAATRHAHALGGSCSHFGAIKLREICIEIENHGRSDELAAAQELLPELDQSFHAVHTQLRNLRDTLNARKRN